MCIRDRYWAERGTGYCSFLLRFCPLHFDAADVCCCSCSWLLLFLSFRLRCFGCGCWLRCCWDGMHAGKINTCYRLQQNTCSFSFFGRGAAAANNFFCRLRCCCCWCLCCLQHQHWSRERYRLLFVPFTFQSFTLRCFGRLLLLLFLGASFSVLQTAMLRLWLLTALLLRRDACWKIHTC